MSTPPGAATQARPPARDNVFTRRIGPLPMWAWVGIVAAVILAWAWWKNRTSPAASTSATNASQVPQFVNQTYTTVMPPSTPTMKPPPPDTGTDKDQDGTDAEDKDKDDRHKRKPVRRKHPTHDRDDIDKNVPPTRRPVAPRRA